jgi:hypothetical protein
MKRSGEGGDVSDDQNPAPAPQASKSAELKAPRTNRRHQRLIDDVRFIFAEVRRLNGLDLKDIPQDDVWFDLPSPSGAGGVVICGRAAARRLEGLAEEAGQRAGLSRRVSLRSLREPLAELIVQRFAREGRPLDGQQIDRVLVAAGKAAEKTCVDLRHLLPCHLMLAQDPNEIPMGPVTFRNRKAMRRLLLERSRARLSEPDESPQKRAFGRRLMADALRYYRAFNWIAEVEIKRCEPEISATLAQAAVTSALDGLHLILSADHTDRMRVGGPALRRDNRAKLTIDPSGQISPSLSLDGPGQVEFPDGWSSRLADPYYQRPLELCAIALEAAVDPDLERPLSRRFLDAAQWFGEAARDGSPSTRVVKYVTALERMLTTEERDDITAMVSTRLAALCFDQVSAESREAWRLKAVAAYDLRSKLVHGSMSPRDPKVWRGVALGAELGEAALLCALNGLGEEGLRLETMSSRRLGRWYDEVIAWSDRMIETQGARPPSVAPSQAD